MTETLRGDGGAVDVDLTETTAKGTVVLYDGFFGITMAAGSSGDTVAMEIAQREHEIAIPEGLSAARGAILYISALGVITTTASDRPFMKVTLAKDANNYVWGILLPQYADTV